MSYLDCVCGHTWCNVESGGLTGVGSWDFRFMVSSPPLISMHNLGHVTANAHLWVEAFGTSWSEGSQLSVYSSTPALRYTWAPRWTASLNSKVLKGAGGWLRKATLQAVTLQHPMLHQLRWGAGSQSEHPQDLECSVYVCFNQPTGDGKRLGNIFLIEAFGAGGDLQIAGTT